MNDISLDSAVYLHDIADCSDDYAVLIEITSGKLEELKTDIERTWKDITETWNKNVLNIPGSLVEKRMNQISGETYIKLTRSEELYNEWNQLKLSCQVGYDAIRHKEHINSLIVADMPFYKEIATYSTKDLDDLLKKLQKKLTELKEDLAELSNEFPKDRELYKSLIIRIKNRIEIIKYLQHN